MSSSNAASHPLQAAFVALDAVHATDPRSLAVRGASVPWTLGEAKLGTLWLAKLAPDASEALSLAVRAHHLRRWETPRTSYPEGRAAYLKWRKDLYSIAFEHAAAILREVGYDHAVIERMSSLMHKRNLKTDAEAQTYEDVLCLVYLESQHAEFSARTDPAKVDGIVAKTLAKMSDAAKNAWAEFSA